MISIIIPTFNKSSRLRLCLYFLSKINIDFNVEVIIVNDGSTDNTDRVVQDQIKGFNNKYNIKIIKTPNKGRACARNIGAQNAQYEIFLFLDDDIILNEDILETHRMLHANSSRIVRGKILHLPYMKSFEDPCVLPSECNTSLKELYKNMVLDLNKGADSCYRIFQKYSRETKFEKLIRKAVLDNNYFKWLCFTGANTSIEKKLFYHIGEFDCKFKKTWGCEDIEFGYRICLNNKAEFIYDASYAAYHLDHFRANYFKEHQINMDYFIEKYPEDEKLQYLSMYFKNLITENELLNFKSTSNNYKER